MSYLKARHGKNDNTLSYIVEKTIECTPVGAMLKDLEKNSTEEYVKNGKKRFKIKLPRDKNGNIKLTDAQIAALEFALKVVAISLLFSITDKLTQVAVKKFSINKIEKTVSNKAMAEYLDSELKRLRDKHQPPKYKICSKKDFKNTNQAIQIFSSFFGRKTGDFFKTIADVAWDELLKFSILPYTLKKLLKYFAPKLAYYIGGQGIMVLLSDIIFTPLKILFGKYGIKIGTGEIYLHLFEYDGQYLEMGLAMTPHGWRLVNARAFFMQNVKDINDDPLLQKIGADKYVLVGFKIEDPPVSAYAPTKEEIDKYVTKFSSMTSKQLDKELKKFASK